jgi:hypothetical protein
MVAVPAVRPGGPSGPSGRAPEGEQAPSTGDLPQRVPGGGRTAIPPTTRQSRPAYGSDPTATFAGRPGFGTDPDATFVGGIPAYGSDPAATFAGQPMSPMPPVSSAPPAPAADQRSNGQAVPPPFGVSPAPYQAQPPVHRPAAEGRNSRANWPLVRDPSESGPYPLVSGNGAADIPQPPSGSARPVEPRIPEQPRPVEPMSESLGIELPRQREGRVKPPWQDDVPAEPPTLRLVEPAPLVDPALSADRTDDLGDLRFDPPTLRLVPAEPDHLTRPSIRPGDELPEPPVESGTDDSDLLIFAECRSAWFTDPSEGEEELDWVTAADHGWEAASQAAQPAVGAETVAGLPRRVPQQNLVPGSPQPQEPEEPERPLRIVRDAAAIAAHTSGYFSGYRRGQEVGGYSVGGRPGRESSVGWDFSRDESGDEEYSAVSDYEYRSARR